MKLKLIAFQIIWGTALASGATITAYTDEAAFIADTGATAIFPTVTGWATPIPDGYALDLLNLSGHANDRTVTLTFLSPVLAFGATLNNAPAGIGSGTQYWIDGVKVAEFGVGVLIQGFAGIVSDVSFSSLKIKTNQAFSGFIREHVDMTGLIGSTPPDGTVPEPGTFGLLGAAMVGLAWWKGRR